MRDLQRINRSSSKIRVIQYKRPKDLQMTRSGNLGIVMEGNGGGVDLKQKGNANLHSIIDTTPLLTRENISTV